MYNMYYYLLLLYNDIYAKQTINKYTNVFNKRCCCCCLIYFVLVLSLVTIK